MKAIAIAALSLTATLVLPSLVLAQDSGFYAGASVGQAKYGSCPGSDCDAKDTGWRVFGGYQFNRYFSAELGYADLGQASSRSTRPGGITFFIEDTFEAETTALDFTGIGSLPLGERFSLFGKLGVYYAEAENRLTRRLAPTSLGGGGSGPSTVTESSSDNSAATFGVGARYDFTRHFGVRVEWQRYAKVGSDATGETDIDFLSASLLYRF